MKTIEFNRTSAEHQRLVELVDEIAAKLQAGEACDVDQYIARYPEYADRLRDWMSVMTAMADLGHSLAVGAASRAALTSADHPTSTIEHPASTTGLLGDFRILRELGRGGMGVVYEAEQVSLGRRVALKVLPFAAMLDRQQLARFKNEARAAATLDHPNIVAIHSVGCERSVHYYAMQLIEGQSLAQVVEQLRARSTEQGARKTAGDCPNFAESAEQNGTVPLSQAPVLPAPGSPLPADTTPLAHLPTLHAPRSSLPAFSSREYYRTIARFGIQAADALDHAHQNGILHRDVKPANLLVDDTGKLWITDFGLARIETNAGMTMTGDILGTLRYMSPEQALAKRVVVDHRSDIYSLGVTLYELLTLQPAYTGDDRHELLRQIAFEDPQAPRKINADIPQDFETIVLKAIEKNPADRYATAQELADDLRRFVDDRPIAARRPHLLARARQWSRRHRPLVVSATLSFAAVVATSLAVLAWSNVAIKHERDEKAAALQVKTAALEYTNRNSKRLIALIGPLFTRFGSESLDDLPELQQLGELLLERASQDLKQQPENWNSWYNRAAVYFQLQRPAESADDLNKAFELAPDEKKTLVRELRSDAYRCSKQYEAAIKDYTALITLNPVNAEALQGRGEVYREMGQFSEALDDATKAIELEPHDPDFWRAWTVRGIARFEMGQFAEAVGDFTKAMEVKPNNADLYTLFARRAIAYKEMKQYREAVADYERAIALKPNEYRLLSPMAWLLATAPIDELRDGKRAVEMSTKVCQLTDYKIADALDTLAATYAEVGDFAAAVRWQEKAIKLVPIDDAFGQRSDYEPRLESYRSGRPWRLQ